MRDTAVMSVGTTLSRITGYLRLSAQTAALGVSALGNTYATANTTPNIIYELVLGGILTSVFVPVFVEWLQKHGREEAWLVADRVLTLALVVLSAVAILGAVFAPQIIRLYLIGLPRREQGGADRARRVLPAVVHAPDRVLRRWARWRSACSMPSGSSPRRCSRRSSTTSAVDRDVRCLRAARRRRERRPFRSITFAEKTILAAGTTLGVVAMTLALWPSLRRLGFRWHFRFDWNHPAVRRLGKLALWVVVYVVANQLAYVVIIVLTGKFPPGGYQVYVERVHLVPAPARDRGGVDLHRAPSADVRTLGCQRLERDCAQLFSRGLRDTAVVIVPAALGYIALALPIVRLLLQHGRAGARGRGADRAHAAGVRRGICRSSPRSNCSRGRSTRCRTRERPRS